LQLSQLPLFPLGMVAFPDGIVSLRIFEVRYLDMIKRCHAAGAPFGIVTLNQGSDVAKPGQTEAFSDVGMLMSIDHLEQPQPGLLHIRCKGLQRFHVQRSERLKHGLWIGDVEGLDSDQNVEIPDDLAHAAASLERVGVQLRERGAPAFDAMGRFNDCGWVANRWLELLPVPPELKLRLMRLDNPLVRLELVGDLLVKLGVQAPEA
jgi:Lon protease-like protein